ncbi:T9SS type A sorting domain-containing protein [candidate division WOR-3 bacterium]|nr:T9SS type A sorting domain-containing protein [candidate division WOR-3 bacterium]
MNIRFTSKDASATKIELFNITGRLIHSFVVDKVKIGTNKTNISLHNITSGIYFIRIENSFDKLTKKVIILK